MASDNVFKFVSLRPPSPPKQEFKFLLPDVKFLEIYQPAKSKGKKRGKGLPKTPSKNTDCIKFLKRVSKGWQYARPIFGMPTLYKEIKKLDDENKRFKAIELAKGFMSSENYYPEIGIWISMANKSCSAKTVREAKNLISKQLGIGTRFKDFCEYIRNRKTIKALDHLWSSLYAQTLAPNHKPEDRERIYDGIRAFQFILASMAMDSDSKSPYGCKDIQKVKPLIPNDLVPEIPKRIDTLKIKDEENIKNPEEINSMKAVFEEIEHIQNIVSDLKGIKSKSRTKDFRSKKPKKIFLDLRAKGQKASNL